MDTKPEGLDGEFARRVIKLMSTVNVAVYRLTRGRIGGTWRVGAGWKDPVPICLVEHRGRRTGKLRTTPLVYLRDGDRVVVVASQAGRPQHPLWYRNLQADPTATVQIRGDRTEMLAHTADPSERAELWPRLVELYRDYDSYQSWTDREIPVVILDPR